MSRQMSRGINNVRIKVEDTFAAGDNEPVIAGYTDDPHDRDKADNSSEAEKKSPLKQVGVHDRFSIDAIRIAARGRGHFI